MHAYKYSCNVLLENLLLSSTTKAPIVIHCIIVFCIVLTSDFSSTDLLMDFIIK